MQQLQYVQYLAGRDDQKRFQVLRKSPNVSVSDEAPSFYQQFLAGSDIVTLVWFVTRPCKSRWSTSQKPAKLTCNLHKLCAAAALALFRERLRQKPPAQSPKTVSVHNMSMHSFHDIIRHACTHWHRSLSPRKPLAHAERVAALQQQRQQRRKQGSST